MMLSLILTSFNVSAQSKADKMKLKAKQANEKLLVENKESLLDGKHQTKMFFSNNDDHTTTSGLCNEFTMGNGKELYLHYAIEDERNNIIVNKSSDRGEKFKEYTVYTGKKYKVNVKSVSIDTEFKIYKNDIEVYNSESGVPKNQDVVLDPKKGKKNYGLAYWVNDNLDKLKEDCKLQCEYIIKYKDSVIVDVKSNVLNWKYDENKMSIHYVKVLGLTLNYYDIESKNKKLVNSAFTNYKKKQRIKSENITVLKIIQKEWLRIDYSNIQKQKGRSSWVLVFYQDNKTKEVHTVGYSLYQDLIGSKFGEVKVFQATEIFERELIFLNQYKKEIGLYLKSHTLDSAL